VVFALSVPFWAIGAVIDVRPMPGLPIAALTFVCPAVTALILTYRECRTARVVALLRRLIDGEPFDRPKASHPVDYGAKCESVIAYLAMVLRLLRAREQTRGERTHMRQGRDLVGQLLYRDIVILGGCHQKYVLGQLGRDASGFIFLIVGVLD
jgi:hypothetical protein